MPLSTPPTTGSCWGPAWPAPSAPRAGRPFRPNATASAAPWSAAPWVTGAGNLKARYVIHAVGPRMGEGDEDAKLRSATTQSLARAEEHGMRSLAFPAISTGIFGFPVDRAAAIMLDAAREHLSGETGLERVVFCLFGPDAYDVFAARFQRLFSEAR